jgi:methionyl-tRNA formyltransferase
LAELGAALLLETLPGYISGSIRPSPQDEDRSTHAPLLRKSYGYLSPDQPAVQLERKVRAFDPWPGTYVEWPGGRLAVLAAHAVTAMGPSEVGRLVLGDGRPALATIDGWLVMDRVQPVGKKSMSGDAFLRGARGVLGSTVAVSGR